MYDCHWMVSLTTLVREKGSTGNCISESPIEIFDLMVRVVNTIQITMTQKIAVIGAGMAGLTAAKILSQKGFSVDVFDKGRGVGGRMSSRRTKWGYLDHGCQYFTLKDPLFKEFLQEYDSLITVWKGRFFTWLEGNFQRITEEKYRYLPTVRMNNLCRQMASEANIALQTPIVSLTRENEQWILIDDQSSCYGGYDWVIVTAPPRQTYDLIKNHSQIAEEVAAFEMYPCYSLMLVMAEERDFGFEGIQLQHPILGWIGVNSSKPERETQLSLVIQSNFDWALMNLEGDRTLIAEIMKKETKEVLSWDLEGILYESLHLWRYALPKSANLQGYYLDGEKKLAICGDWCLSGKVESAFLSAYSLVRSIFLIPN